MINISIETKSGHPDEQATKEKLLKLLGQYDISRYVITNKVLIEKGAIPHSHPILTINTRKYSVESNLLAVLLHEQLHWHLDKYLERVRAAIAELRLVYPKVPVGFPDGARNEQSTYLHLLLCPIEYCAARKIFGNKEARRLLDFWKQDIYRWVYKIVDEDLDKLMAINKKYQLEIP